MFSTASFNNGTSMFAFHLLSTSRQSCPSFCFAVCVAAEVFMPQSYIFISTTCISEAQTSSCILFRCLLLTFGGSLSTCSSPTACWHIVVSTNWSDAACCQSLQLHCAVRLLFFFSLLHQDDLLLYVRLQCTSFVHLQRLPLCKMGLPMDCGTLRTACVVHKWREGVGKGNSEA